MAIKILAIEEKIWFNAPILLQEVLLDKDLKIIPFKEGIGPIKKGGIFYDFYSINGGIKSYKKKNLKENVINILLYNKNDKDKLIKNAKYEGYIVQLVEGDNEGDKIPLKDIKNLLNTGKVLLNAEELKQDNKYLV